MSEIKWIKLSIEMFDDEKIKLIQAMPEGDSLLLIWIRILILAGKVNDKGLIYLSDTLPYTDDMLATIFNKPVQIVRLALKTFSDMKMIDIDQKVISIVNWDKYQNVNGMEKVREQNRDRVSRFREREKLIEIPTVTLSNVTVTKQNKNKNKNIDIDKDNIKKIYKEKYGEFKNVLLSDEEYEKLKILFNTSLQEKIENLSAYCQSTGKKYKDYYATLLNWARRDEKRGNNATNRPVNRCTGSQFSTNYEDPDVYFKRAADARA